MDEAVVRAVDRVARTRRGLVTSTQATELLGRRRFQRWREDGRLLPVQPRVYRLAGAPPTWHQRLLAASLSSGGVVSHRSAAMVWDLVDLDEDDIHVSVGYPRSARLWSPATLHRIRDLCDEHTVVREGLRITTPMRTVVDLGLMASWTEVDLAIGRGIGAKLFPLTAVERVRNALARPGRNGTGVALAALDARLLRGAPEDSAVELRLLRLLERRGLRPPAFQHEVWHEGRFVARVDAAYPQLLLALEVDGFAAHGSPEAFQHDRTRQNRLAELGWTVLRFTWHDIVRRSSVVSRTVATTIDRLTA